VILCLGVILIESNRTQNDSSRDPSFNHSVEPSNILELTNMITTQPNASGQLSSCVAPNQELQLFPQLIIFANISNVVHNLVQWPIVQQNLDLITSIFKEQCSYSLDFYNFNCAWLNNTKYTPFHIGLESWVQTKVK
jgi:hypothetical protein